MSVMVAAFTAIDWQRIDVWAIVQCGGLGCVEPARHAACPAWLERERYTFDTLNFGSGLADAVSASGQLMQWERQFGYSLDGGSCNLDALRDGFEFDAPAGGGQAVGGVVPERATLDVVLDNQVHGPDGVPPRP